MTADLDLGVEILGHPTVREPDGLALSSRNRRLSPEERRAATCLPRAIRAGIAAATGGSPADVLAAARGVVEAEPLARLDYVSVFHAWSLEPVDHFPEEERRPGSYRIAIAATVGPVRLIDNADLFD
jgi:pantoate--beta-alanine ligase